MLILSIFVFSWKNTKISGVIVSNVQKLAEGVLGMGFKKILVISVA